MGPKLGVFGVDIFAAYMFSLVCFGKYDHFSLMFQQLLTFSGVIEMKHWAKMG